MANNFKTTIELSAQSPSGNLLYTTLELPATRGEITDAAHRLRNLPVSEIVITGSDALPELADTRLDAPTVDELNFFASRVNALPDDELAALGGVFLHRGILGEFEDGLTMKDLINMTYYNIFLNNWTLYLFHDTIEISKDGGIVLWDERQV